MAAKGETPATALGQLSPKYPAGLGQVFVQSSPSAAFRHQTRKHSVAVILPLGFVAVALILCMIVPNLPTGVVTGAIMLAALSFAIYKFGFFAIQVWLLMASLLIWMLVTFAVNRRA